MTERKMSYRIWTYDDEIVPNAEQFPHIDRAGLVLHRLREQRDEVRRAKVRAVYWFFFQVAVQVRQYHRYQPVKPVKVQLKHRQFRIEQGTQFEDVDDLAHDCERQCLVLEEKIEEACDKIHALTVV